MNLPRDYDLKTIGSNNAKSLHSHISTSIGGFILSSLYLYNIPTNGWLQIGRSKILDFVPSVRKMLFSIREYRNIYYWWVFNYCFSSVLQSCIMCSWILGIRADLDKYPSLKVLIRRIQCHNKWVYKVCNSLRPPVLRGP